ncbi:MAG TPA: hypothetical protein VFY32_16105, partial [Solirubrobacteraceae bacterium]|nr:hypothetical protein [Solirubrobacteraceae bacterium]
MSQFVSECANLLVAGPRGDDNLAALGVTPATRPVVGEVADRDAVAELGGMGDERGDQVVVRVAGDRLRRRGQRDGLLARQRVGATHVPHGHGPKEHALAAGLLTVLVAVPDGDGGEDPDALALARHAVELQPRAKASDIGQGDAAPKRLDRQDHLVPEAVPGEAVAGANPDPALPSVAGQQGAGGLLDALAIGLAARVALSVGERLVVEAAGHGGAPWTRGPPRWRAD